MGQTRVDTHTQEKYATHKKSNTPAQNTTTDAKHVVQVCRNVITLAVEFTKSIPSSFNIIHQYRK